MNDIIQRLFQDRFGNDHVRLCSGDLFGGKFVVMSGDENAEEGLLHLFSDGDDLSAVESGKDKIAEQDVDAFMFQCFQCSVLVHADEDTVSALRQGLFKEERQ